MDRRAAPLNGRTALVTGASSGFGLLISLELARRGFRVAACMRRPEASEPLRSAAREEGTEERITVFRMDVTDETSVRTAVRLASGQLGGSLDVLVNNAGAAWGGFAEEVPLDVWREQMETNFIGAVSVTRAILPLMRERGRGHIIQMSSISGVVGFPGFAPYAASKFALEGFSESLALEVRPFGIQVSIVEPGAYGTAIWDKGFARISAAPQSPYAAMLEALLAYARRSAEGGGDPLEVARRVGSIACSRRPKLRYRLPTSAALTMTARKWLPARWFGRLVVLALKGKNKNRP